MPYCPNCLAEYVEGTTNCEDCGTPLVPGSPPENGLAKKEIQQGSEVQLVRLRTFSGPTALLDADLAKNLLNSQGILCVLPGEVTAETLPGVDVVQVLVRKEDAQRAAQILASYMDSEQPSPPE
ncbi:MAG TPA: DUF2007 domain-containing protein [Terriglobia bacterium]|nr:DUF2007 domain-containing protein [Terriglobia bacterium]